MKKLYSTANASFVLIKYFPVRMKCTNDWNFISETQSWIVIIPKISTVDHDDKAKIKIKNVLRIPI